MRYPEARGGGGSRCESRFLARKKSPPPDFSHVRESAKIHGSKPQRALSHAATADLTALDIGFFPYSTPSVCRVLSRNHRILHSLYLVEDVTRTHRSRLHWARISRFTSIVHPSLYCLCICVGWIDEWLLVSPFFVTTRMAIANLGNVACDDGACGTTEI
jgi:hypothetical protein